MAMYEFSQEARQILEASKVASAILQVGEDGYHVLLVSDGACNLFGLDRSRLTQYLNNKSYGKMHPDDAGRLLEASRSRATEDELSIVVRMSLRGDDTFHPIFFKANAYYTPDGTRLIQMTYIDIDAVTGTSEAWASRYQQRQDNRYFLDDVTSLPNSNHFREFAKGTLKSILDEGGTPLVVLFDIHGMHFYNDSFGYEAGDELLRRTGAIIRTVFPTEFVVRYLEDHFVVILPENKLGNRVDEVRAQVRAYANGDSLDIEAGIYKYTDPAESAASALDRARRAVDSIHDQPDEYLCWYTSAVEERYYQQNYVLSHYREAIEQGWVKVYYQPLVSTLSGNVSHCEALARWIDPTLGFLSPASFIGVLEENHRVWELDLEIIRQVARDIRDARASGRYFPPLSVNVSRHDLAVPDFHERINDILSRYGVAHDEIAIEITESALVEHEEFIEQHVQRFHEDGFQVWLDDFGSGYSSFNALQNFDFDLLKIDMQFLRGQNRRTPRSSPRSSTSPSAWASVPSPRAWRRPSKSSSCARLAAAFCRGTSTPNRFRATSSSRRSTSWVSPSSHPRTGSSTRISCGSMSWMRITPSQAPTSCRSTGISPSPSSWRRTGSIASSMSERSASRGCGALACPPSSSSTQRSTPTITCFTRRCVAAAAI